MLHKLNYRSLLYLQKILGALVMGAHITSNTDGLTGTKLVAPTTWHNYRIRDGSPLHPTPDEVEFMIRNGFLSNPYEYGRVWRMDVTESSIRYFGGVPKHQNKKGVVFVVKERWRSRGKAKWRYETTTRQVKNIRFRARYAHPPTYRGTNVRWADSLVWDCYEGEISWGGGVYQACGFGWNGQRPLYWACDATLSPGMSGAEDIVAHHWLGDNDIEVPEASVVEPDHYCKVDGKYYHMVLPPSQFAGEQVRKKMGVDYLFDRLELFSLGYWRHSLMSEKELETVFNTVNPETRLYDTESCAGATTLLIYDRNGQVIERIACKNDGDVLQKMSARDYSRYLPKIFADMQKRVKS